MPLKLCEEKINKIKELSKQGLTMKEIAELAGVSVSSVDMYMIKDIKDHADIPAHLKAHPQWVEQFTREWNEMRRMFGAAC